MGEVQELQLHKMDENEAKETFSLEKNSFEDQTMNKKTRYYFKLAFYATLVLVGQSSATLLGRLYFEKGGKSKWMATVIQLAGASAGYGLVLSLTQLAFKKVLKNENFKAIMDMIIYQSLVATCATLIGLFASGEWNSIKKEMEEFEMGKASYVLDLTFIAISWQVFNIGSVGLIFEISSLFSNAISVLGLPIVPILAVAFFQEKMDGIKAISMVLAVWGFISYVYQQYLDESNNKVENRNTLDVTKGSLPLEEVNIRS
ncbi:putative purine permease [Trifolium repens]|nr:putative purine permease [Trifolium repens]